VCVSLWEWVEFQWFISREEEGAIGVGTDWERAATATGMWTLQEQNHRANDSQGLKYPGYPVKVDTS